MALADLHLHSTASDGLLSPAEIVAHAKVANLEVIALTDHDTTAGLNEALAAGEYHSLRVLPGIELSTDLAKEEIHILGYLLDYRNQELQELLGKIKGSRAERIKEMVSRLRNLGFDLTWQEVTAAAGKKASSLGRPHVARLMVEKGYASSIKEVFSRWIGSGCDAYVPRYKLHPAEAIEIIQQAGGLAFLAHPGLLGQESLIPQLAGWGLDGIEVYHPEHRSAQAKSFLKTAETLGLYVSGGSDCHGSPDGIKLGEAAISLQAIPWIKD
ncbi:MAG TPA: phosphatase [Firmicutes bacterium]|jgi:hypothetical protein|nr:phosphatase [Bacillota bacterium]HBS92734.1 phosphatase [Bacillota bacterium]HCX78244.1 phosphatase [Bacillota bacterium]